MPSGLPCFNLTFPVCCQLQLLVAVFSLANLYSGISLGPFLPICPVNMRRDYKNCSALYCVPQCAYNSAGLCCLDGNWNS